MDKKSLSYHTKVQDWSQLYRLTADGKIYKDSKEITYLSPQKIQEIDSWRNNVRKKLNKNKSTNTTQGKNQSLNNSQKRIPSAKTKVLIKNEFSRSGASSAASKVITNTDLHSVSNHLAETSVHYAAMRKDIYSANKKRSITPQTKSILNGMASEVPKKIDKVIQFENNVDKQNSSSQGSKREEDRISDIASETISLASTSRMTDRGKVIQVKDKRMISVRSASNNLLNVISIDDCKMALSRQQYVYSVNSERTGNKSVASDYKTTNSVANSVDPHLHENRSATANGSAMTTTYYPSTPSRLSSRHSKTDPKARVTKAIDGMVNDRKVMNNLDRNFDARIGSKDRLVLEKKEGGVMFKKLHGALRKHIDNILAVQAHRRMPDHMAGNGKHFTSYIQQIANSMMDGENYSYTPEPAESPRSSRSNYYQSHSSLHSYKEQPTIFEEENEDTENDSDKNTKMNENQEFTKHAEDLNRQHENRIPNVVNGHHELASKQNSSSGRCSSDSSMSIQNFSDVG